MTATATDAPDTTAADTSSVDYAKYDLLPLRGRMNPADPSSSDNHNAKHFGYVVKAGGNDKQLRILTQADGEAFKLGDKFDMRHTKTGAKLGIAEVIAVVKLSKDGTTEGETVDRRIPHYLFQEPAAGK